MRADLPDHGGIVQGSDEAQSAPAARARQDINGKRPVHESCPSPGAPGGLHSGGVQTSRARILHQAGDAIRPVRPRGPIVHDT